MCCASGGPAGHRPPQVHCLVAVLPFSSTDSTTHYSYLHSLPLASHPDYCCCTLADLLEETRSTAAATPHSTGTTLCGTVYHLYVLYVMWYRKTTGVLNRITLLDQDGCRGPLVTLKIPALPRLSLEHCQPLASNGTFAFIPLIEQASCKTLPISLKCTALLQRLMVNFDLLACNIT